MQIRRNRNDCTPGRCGGRVPAAGTASAALVLLSLGLAVGGYLPGASADTGQRFHAERVIAFGDVHGAYDELLRLLSAAGVIDAQSRWAAGSAHVVSLGDILDRGKGARPAMDLLMRLQTEAAAAGGRLHVVLGNHELMNLIGDLRYVPEEEFTDFAGESRPDTDGTAVAAGGPAVDPGSATAIPPASRPPGYAARHAAYAPGGVYGRWLLEQPAVVVINDTAYVHGGLPPIAATLGPEALDRTIRSRLVELLELRATLEEAGIIEPLGDVQGSALRLEEARNASLTPAPPMQASAPPTPTESVAASDPALAAQVTRFIELAEDALFGDGGPLWYRGTALCHEVLERPVLESALANWGVRRVVVGHTPTPDRRVRARFEGQAILADTGMLQEYYRGQPAALIIEGPATRVLYANDPTTAATPDLRAGLEFDGLDLATVEALVTDGTLAPAEPEASSAGTRADVNGPAPADATRDDALPSALPPGTTLVTASTAGASITALFEPGSRAEIDRQLAAYRLDRLLGLGLVAPVAAREFAGRRGVVSARWTRTLDEQSRAAGNVARQNWCARGSDFQLLYAFDALIRNMGRNANNMLYDRSTWQLASIGHADSFGRGRDLPAYLANAPQRLPAGLARALRTLDEATLAAALGELLPRAQQRAVLQRRDDLLTNWATETVLP